MKNKREIISFISTIIPQTKEDKAKIAEFCSKMDIFVDFNYNIHCRSQITFEGFVSWIEGSRPKVGDTIVYDQHMTIGLVSSSTEKSIHLGIAILGTDGLVTTGLDRPNENYRYATNDEILRIHQLLNRKGFTWNIWRNSFLKSVYKPRHNLYVRFGSYTKDDYGIGIFKEISPEGKLVMFCLARNDKPVCYSLHEVIGDADRYQIASATKIDIAYLKRRLEEDGKVWNGYYNRIEPITFIINSGERYYYINDKGDIKSARKNDSETFRRRFAFGNTFVNQGEAEELRDKIRECIKTQLSKPEQEP